jgi:dTDP-4-dehydrorhamnose reductase
MKLRAGILGKEGRLGTALCRELRTSCDVIPLGRADIDLSEPAKMAESLKGLECDVFINTAAATDVDWCEQNPEPAWAINAASPAEIGQWTAQKQIRFIQLSTDYVFNGRHNRPYREEDVTDPLNVYGRTKRCGELDSLAANPKTLVLRVSWIFGPDKPSFLEKILNRARNATRVEAVSNKYSTPTYTRDLARWLKHLLDNDSICGVLHVCNSGACSWREWGQVAIDAAKSAGTRFQTDFVNPVPLESLTTFVADRPRYTALDTAKFQELTGVRPRPWEEAVQEYVREHYRGARPFAR